MMWAADCWRGGFAAAKEAIIIITSLAAASCQGRLVGKDADLSSFEDVVGDSGRIASQLETLDHSRSIFIELYQKGKNICLSCGLATNRWAILLHQVNMSLFVFATRRSSSAVIVILSGLDGQVGRRKRGWRKLNNSKQ